MKAPKPAARSAGIAGISVNQTQVTAAPAAKQNGKHQRAPFVNVRIRRIAASRLAALPK